MKFKNDSGRSMLEMILYLGLIVILTASTLKMYSDSVEKTRLIKAEDQIADIVEKVNNYYMGREFPTTGQLETTLKTKLGDDINLISPWGSKVTIYANKTGVTGNPILSKPYFGVKFANLTEAQCVNIANIFIGQFPVAVGINKDAVVTDASKAIPSVSDMAADCNKEDATNYVMGWFLKD